MTHTSETDWDKELDEMSKEMDSKKKIYEKHARIMAKEFGMKVSAKGGIKITYRGGDEKYFYSWGNLLNELIRIRDASNYYIRKLNRKKAEK